MYVYLSKILPLLVLPVGVVILLLGLSLLLHFSRKSRASVIFLALGFSILVASSLPVVDNSLYFRLEQKYPATDISDLPQTKCLVLLGGAIRLPGPSRPELELTEASDRVLMAAKIYHQDKARLIFITAGNQPWSVQGPSEATYLAQLLNDWGVPSSALILEGNSRNTYENAANSVGLLKKGGCGSPLLVTSAGHMQRAVAAFEAVGVSVIPVPTDFRSTQDQRYALMDFLPNSHALDMTTDAIREWMGQKVYQWKEWN